MKQTVVLVIALLSFLAPRHSFGGTLVQFNIYFGANTYLGEVDVELYDQDKPVTVQNFLTYVKAGVFGNGFFNRCLPNFVVQGGGAYTANRFDTNLFTSWFFVPTLPPITNEYFTGHVYSNTFGTIAMARGTDLNSAVSEFYFNLGDNSVTLGNSTNYYAVFGHTVRGSNVLAFFNTLVKPGGGIVDMTTFYGVSPFTQFVSDLPVDYAGNVPPRTSDLVYVDISLVNMQVTKLTNNKVQIAWNSVNGVTNRVEYTTNFPPNWQLLVSTNGNGLPLAVTDSSTNKPGRFYRVHVLY